MPHIYLLIFIILLFIKLTNLILINIIIGYTNIKYLGVETLPPVGSSITVELSACGANRNLAFDDAMLFIGEKPTVLGSGKCALLSITTFGPLCADATETDVRCAYGVQE